jgi:hypothetical protein
MDRLHPATRGIVDEPEATAALFLARRLSASPPADWDPREWATIAAAAGSRMGTDPRWLKVKILALESELSDTAATDALRTRARLIALVGDDDSDAFCSLATFIERAQALVGTDTPETALASYVAARPLLFRSEQGSPSWLDARQAFIRCRRLRELGKILLGVVEDGRAVPEHLALWTSWAHLREEDLTVADG